MKYRCLRFGIVFLSVLSSVSTADAGAWLKAEGETFLSFGVTTSVEDDTGKVLVDQDIFLEYGLRPRLTMGAKLRYAGNRGGEGHVFFRLPLRADDRPSKISAELAFGGESDGPAIDPYLRSGLSWGRGISLAERGGWVNVDAGAQVPLNSGTEMIWNLDATVGVNLNDRFQVMGQGFLSTDSSEDSLTLSPSLIYKHSPTTRWVLGAERKTGSAASTGLKLNMWREF